MNWIEDKKFLQLKLVENFRDISNHHLGVNFHFDLVETKIPSITKTIVN